MSTSVDTGGTGSTSDTGGTGSTSVNVTIDPASIAAISAAISADLTAFAPVLAKAFFDEYFARLAQINNAQIALQNALNANNQVNSIKTQIANLQDNNSLISNVSQTPSSGKSATQIQTDRNNFQIGLLNSRLQTAESQSQTV